MSYADLSQARLYYVIDGPADAPVLVLSTAGHLRRHVGAPGA